MFAPYNKRQQRTATSYGVILFGTGVVFAICLRLTGDSPEMVLASLGVALHAAILFVLARWRLRLDVWSGVATLMANALMAWVLLATGAWDVLHWVAVPIMLARWLTNARVARWCLIISLVSAALLIMGRLSDLTPAPWLPTSPMLARASMSILFILTLALVAHQNAISFESAVMTEERKAKELSEEIELHESTRLELHEAQKRMVGAARLAGMAEIATGILHNVGNVLTSITVSSQMLRRADHGQHAAGRLRTLAAAMDSKPLDPAKVVLYLNTVADQLQEQQGSFDDEISRLTEAVHHVQRIVSAQQAHARSAGVTETFSLLEMLQHAQYLTQYICAPHDVTVCADPQLHLTTERHPLVQIIENLIRNAAESMSDAGMAGRIDVTAVPSSQGLLISVQDTGPGLRPEDVEHIFQHGYTTKATGSGFGLHASALNASSLGGSLAVDTTIETGACFRLVLPNELMQAQSHLRASG